MDWIEFALDKSSSIAWVTGIFIFFLVLFHVVLVWWCPLKPINWKRVEYIWVSMAFFSALGLIDEARIYRAETQFDQESGQVTKSLKQVNNWVENYRVFSCEEEIFHQQLCQLIKQLKNDIEIVTALEPKIPEIDVGMLNAIQESTTILNSNEKSMIHDLITQYEQHREKYMLADQERQQLPFKHWLTIFTPVLFAAALALKMTTISGELSHIKHKQ